MANKSEKTKVEERWIAARPNANSSVDMIDENNIIIGTIINVNDAKEIAHRWNCFNALVNSIDHTLIASEDGGDMDDIDWNMLRMAVNDAKNKPS